jgi:hypothetical protein
MCRSMIVEPDLLCARGPERRPTEAMESNGNLLFLRDDTPLVSVLPPCHNLDEVKFLKDAVLIPPRRTCMSTSRR